MLDRRTGRRVTSRARFPRGGAAAFEISSLALTGWWDGPGYSGSTVTGKASAGDSGTRNLTVSGTPGTTTVNSVSAIALDGANDYLTYSTGAEAADLTNPTSWTMSFVGVITASGADDVQPYENPWLGGSSDANWAIGVDSAGNIEAYQYQGGNKVATRSWTTTVLTNVQARYDGTNIECRLGKNAWATTASTTPLTALGTFRIGCNRLLSAFLTGTFCEYLITDTALSDATLDQIADAHASRWGVSV